MDLLLAKLSEQQRILSQQRATSPSSGDSNEENIEPRQLSVESSPDEGKTAEVSRLRQELDAARIRIARQDQELYRSRLEPTQPDSSVVRLSDAALSPTLQSLGNPYTSNYAWDHVEDDIPDLPAQWSPIRQPHKDRAMSSNQWGLFGNASFRDYSVTASPPGRTQLDLSRDIGSQYICRGRNAVDTAMVLNDSTQLSRPPFGSSLSPMATEYKPDPWQVTVGKLSLPRVIDCRRLCPRTSQSITDGFETGP